VPHAGRHYPAHLLAQARVPKSVLERLEDRHVDVLMHGLGDAGYSSVVAQYARALIDLNRSEQEWDSAMIADRMPDADPGRHTRGGLGLVPWRLHGEGVLWRDRLSYAALEQRITTVHRPYHAAIRELIAQAKRQWGGAVLIDVHSMPTQPAGPGGAGPQIVIGDRHGQTASSELVEQLIGIAEGAGLRASRNAPYAGAATIARHASPARGIDAVQIEFDRALYLDAAGACDAAGCRAMRTVLRDVTDAAAHWVLARRGFAQAAE
jgi:N-formylglutamate amidohydrolase